MKLESIAYCIEWNPYLIRIKLQKLTTLTFCGKMSMAWVASLFFQSDIQV